MRRRAHPNDFPKGSLEWSSTFFSAAYGQKASLFSEPSMVWLPFREAWFERGNDQIFPKIEHWGKICAWKKYQSKSACFEEYAVFEGLLAVDDPDRPRLTDALKAFIDFAMSVKTSELKRFGFGDLAAVIIRANQEVLQFFLSKAHQDFIDTYGFSTGLSLSAAWWGHHLKASDHEIQKVLNSFFRKYISLLRTRTELFEKKDDLRAFLARLLVVRPQLERLPKTLPNIPIPPTAPLAPPAA